jgi:hypothetical protein
MNRRDILGLGALAAGATAGIPGCTVPRLVSTMRGPEGVAAFNAMLDAELAKLETPGLLHRIAEEQGRGRIRAGATAALAEKDATFRRMLGAIFVSQSFRELPEETQQHPDVQARMWQHMDAISGAVWEVGDMLSALDANQRAELRTKLKEKPELAMDVGEALDARAARAGLSNARRRQLRQMMSTTSFRLRSSNPSSVIDEYVDKVTKLRETSARDADAIDTAVEVGERDFWRNQRMRLDEPTPPGAPPVGAPPPTPPTGPVAPPVPDPTAPDPAAVSEPVVADSLSVVRMLTQLARRAAKLGHCTSVNRIGHRVRSIDADFYTRVFANDPLLANCAEGNDDEDAVPEVKAPKHPGVGGLRTGGYILGVGVIVSLVSIPLIVAIIGLFTLTAGVILMGIGLIVLYVSALIYVSLDE